MSAGWQFYFSTVMVYLCVDILACLGLNLQFGVAGIVNFAFIVFQAGGAYTAAVLSLGPPTRGGFQHYLFGARWPFPLPLLAAAAVGAALSAVVGLIALRRLRTDYQAMVFLVISLIATSVVTNRSGLFNGSAGLATIPRPLFATLGVSLLTYQWYFVGFSAALCLITFVAVQRITSSPLGRLMYAARDNEQAISALGKNVHGLRMTAFVIGGAIAGLSGGLLGEFITAWSPGSWLFVETFVLFTALIVGGSGNNIGSVVGALLVPVIFLEATRFLPAFGGPDLIGALQWIAVGLITIVFIWFWPRGLVPERRRTFSRGGDTQPVAVPGGSLRPGSPVSRGAST